MLPDPVPLTAERPHETVMAWEGTPLKLGLGVTREVGHDVRALGARSALVVTDPNLARLGLADRVRELLEKEGVETVVFDEVAVEPTDQSCTEAARRIESLHLDIDVFVGLGGGSSIDTAKVLNMLGSHPGTDLRRHLNRPIGDGVPVPGPLRPLVAVPTTAGSGSECTAMVALGVVDLRLKTGLGDRHLRPALALVDPLNTVTMPPGVTASSGYDVLTHACESLTARPYDRRPPYDTPADRPMYVGANPISDVWAEQALALVGRYLRRAVLNPHDIEARTGMAQAAAYAGMGFGSAGTHIPHANAYPVAGLVGDYVPAGYETDHPLVPHGQAVVATAAPAFEFTYAAAPERHLRAAELLGANLAGVTVRNGRDALPAALADIVADTGGPRGIADFGFTVKDLPALVDGAMQQQRLLSCCPRPVEPADVRRIFEGSLQP